MSTIAPDRDAGSAGLLHRIQPVWTSLLAAAAAAAGLFLPLTSGGAAGLTALGASTPVVASALLAPSLIVALVALAVIGRVVASALLVPVGLLLALLAVLAADAPGAAGYWLLFWGGVIGAFGGVGRVTLVEAAPDEPPAFARIRSLLPPMSVPLVLLLLWQGLVVGFGVPKGIWPGVHHVAAVLVESWPVLLSDSYVTFVKEVLFGFAIGLTGGFLVGVAISYSVFLQKGFLPIAAAFGAVPIVGLAPVLGRAFGVDWESKAAVVVIVTFFPVVLNTVAGLTVVDRLRLELLKGYAATPRQIFIKLRFPNALPFVFNALKLAVVISVISVIVAEFLIPGPPVGLGQRISLSARRGAFDVVFAAIFVSSAFSILLYGLVSAFERWMTGWHPSFREEVR